MHAGFYLFILLFFAVALSDLKGALNYMCYYYYYCHYKDCSSLNAAKHLRSQSSGQGLPLTSLSVSVYHGVSSSQTFPLVEKVYSSHRNCEGADPIITILLMHMP